MTQKHLITLLLILFTIVALNSDGKKNNEKEEIEDE